MRLKTGIWIRAYIRICAGANCPAYVVRHGDDDAGAPYIKINHLDGTASLYGPAPAGFDEVVEGQRFAAVFANGTTPERKIDDYIAHLGTHDPDLWLVEVEDAKKRHFLDGWLEAG